MKKTIGCLIGIATVLLLSAGTALAEQPESAIMAYGQVGGLIPVSKLDPNASVRIGTAFVFPWLKQRLALALDFGYAQTPSDGEIVDSRVNGGDTPVAYKLTERDFSIFMGPQVFILDPFGFVVPYAALGLNVHMLKSDIEGDADAQALGANSETSTQFGIAVRGGAGIKVGPGLITAELDFGWAPLKHDVTGDSSLAQFSLLIGYAALFAL